MILKALVGAVLCVTIGAGAGPALGMPASPSISAGRFELHLPVVYYHRIKCYPEGASAPGNYTCPAQFETQLTYLRDHGWRTITIDDLADLMAARQCPEPRTFVVSLDDGADDGYLTAAPILEGLGMRGTFFVNPGYAGIGNHMTFSQMRDLVERGHAIGNHSLTHVSLPGQPIEVLHEQIEDAQQLLEAELGYRPRTFAYPYGRYGKTNDDVINAVRDSGFELAFTVVRGAREASDAPLLSRRVRIAPKDTGEEALARLEPFADGCSPPTADLAVGLSKTGLFNGGNVFASTPLSSQTIRRHAVVSGHTYGYWIRLENDSQFSDTFQVAASISGPAANVRFLVSGVDVTDQVANGSYTTGTLQPWSSMLIRARVTIGPGGAGAQAISIVIQAQPTTAAERMDVARFLAVY